MSEMSKNRSDPSDHSLMNVSLQRYTFATIIAEYQLVCGQFATAGLLLPEMVLGNAGVKPFTTLQLRLRRRTGVRNPARTSQHPVVSIYSRNLLRVLLRSPRERPLSGRVIVVVNVRD